MGTGDSGTLELRFLVPTKIVGLIIGKSGDNIKKLRSKYTNRINISENPGPERILTLEGDINVSIEILESILQRQVVSQNDSLLDIRLLVHHNQAGILIGKGGAKIKEFRETSGLKSLKIHQNMCPNSTDRVVQIVGDKDDIIPFIKEVAEILNSSSIKGNIQNYIAAFYDETKSYGGWGNLDLSSGSIGGGKRNRYDTDVIQSSFSYYKPNKNSIGSGGGAKYHNNGSSPNGGMMNGAFCNRIHSSGLGHNNNGHSPNDTMMMNDFGLPNRDMIMNHSPTTTTQVSISDKMIGAIMGKGGARINQVRRESGADIKINQHKGDVEDRIITITGTPDQIQNAQFLLQVCVKKYGDQS